MWACFPSHYIKHFIIIGLCWELLLYFLWLVKLFSVCYIFQQYSSQDRFVTISTFKSSATRKRFATRKCLFHSVGHTLGCKELENKLSFSIHLIWSIHGKTGLLLSFHHHHSNPIPFSFSFHLYPLALDFISHLSMIGKYIQIVQMKLNLNDALTSHEDIQIILCNPR